MRLVISLLVASVLCCLMPGHVLARAGSQDGLAGGQPPAEAVEEEAPKQRVRHHGFNRETEKKKTVIKLNKQDKKDRAEKAGRIASKSGLELYTYPPPPPADGSRLNETADQAEPKAVPASGRKSAGAPAAVDPQSGSERVPGQQNGPVRSSSKTSYVPPVQGETAVSGDKGTAATAAEPRPERKYSTRPSGPAKRSTVIVLPPKKETGVSTRRAPVVVKKKEEPYGYNPEQRAAEREKAAESKARRQSWSSNRNDKRRVTTIALPSKTASVKSSEEALTALPAAESDDSKFRDKRTAKEQRGANENSVKVVEPASGKRSTARGAAAAESLGLKAEAETDPVPQKADSGRGGKAAGGGRKSDPKRSASRVKDSARIKAEEDTKTAALATVPVPAALPVNSAEDMRRAYQAFDLAYQGSLGKTRKELTEVWGFPMQKMGDNGDEAVYGFRQRGVMADVPELDPKNKRLSHYTSGNAKPGQSGKNFACLVILWVDKGGRGVVVDGDAVGDCFLVEALPQKPVHFER